MHYLILTDSGHGMDTAGKRTPLFDDGTFMRENEFNEGCRKYFEDMFKGMSNVTIFNVSAETEDTPLATRVARANFKLAELVKIYGEGNITAVYISFHANAYLGTWGTWGGQGVFYYTGSTQGQKLAVNVLSELVKGTTLRDRGTDPANFYVLKYTRMPAVLIEAAFMDNKEEAMLLLSETFRKETGEDAARGIANYLGITFTPVYQRGSKGDAVSNIQVNLNTLGAKLVVDGSFGPATEAAVKAFQTQVGLMATGIVNQTTQDAIATAVAEKIAAEKKAEEERLAAEAAAKAAAEAAEAERIRRDTPFPEGTWLRVVSGSYKTRGEAEDQAAKLVDKGFEYFFSWYHKEEQ